MCVRGFGSYDDHGEEGEAHQDTLHLDEQHGAWQPGQHGGVEAGDHTADLCPCQATRRFNRHVSVRQDLNQVC